MLIATPERIKEIDRFASERLGIPGRVLMQNAGVAAAEEISRRIPPHSRVCVICGSGKNGGDGYVAAGRLFDAGHEVSVIEYYDGAPSDGDSAYYRAEFSHRTKRMYKHTDAESTAIIENSTVVVDAVFGIGFHGEMPGHIAAAINRINARDCFRAAVDCPSGIDIRRGTRSECVFRADLTVTMEFPKAGLLVYPAREFVGELVVADIGVSESEVAKEFEFNEIYTDDEFARKLLARRAHNTNKGSFGRLLAVVGSRNMPGAAFLASLGAERCGVGLFELAACREVINAVASRIAEPIYTEIPDTSEWRGDTIDIIGERASRATAVLVGCGLSKSEYVKMLVAALAKTPGGALILDADALNSLEGDVDILGGAEREIIITPHPRELSRLVGIDVEKINENRYSTAAEIAKKYNITVLLKGAGTVIAASDGRIFINSSGGAELAKGGSGDALAGMIASFAAQGFDRAESAALAAYLHGRAGEALAGEYSEYGVLPEELPAAAAREAARIIKNEETK